MEGRQKERLEQELKFLKESLAADIITTEEYEKGVKRITSKIDGLEEKEVVDQEREATEEQTTIEDVSEEEVEDKEMQGFDDRVGVAEEKQEKKEDTEEVITEGDIEGKKAEEEPMAKGQEEKQSDLINEHSEKTDQQDNINLNKKRNKSFKLNKKTLVILSVSIILIVSFFFIFANKGDSGQGKHHLEEDIVPVCTYDSDCIAEGKIGACLHPGTEDANCEFSDAVKLNLTVLNDVNCLSCDTSRMISLIKGLFPGVSINNLDYSSADGMKLVNRLDLDSLPAYIFDSKVDETKNYGKFNKALVKKGDFYLIKNSASGSSYYFKRESTPHSLQLFILTDNNSQLDRSMEEILDLFKDKIYFTKRIISYDEKNSIRSELGITAYPTFLVNNQLKFGGIQSSEAIKNKFCELNNLAECKIPLSMTVS